jgi:hypothetical protein
MNDHKHGHKYNHIHLIFLMIACNKLAHIQIQTIHTMGFLHTHNYIVPPKSGADINKGVRNMDTIPGDGMRVYCYQSLLNLNVHFLSKGSTKDSLIQIPF